MQSRGMDLYPGILKSVTSLQSSAVICRAAFAPAQPRAVPAPPERSLPSPWVMLLLSKSSQFFSFTLFSTGIIPCAKSLRSHSGLTFLVLPSPPSV